MDNENVFGFLAVLVLAAIGVWFFIGGEVEGTINTADCRVQYEVEDKIWNRIFHQYVCTYNKTEKGEIMSGSCSRIKTGLFSGECLAEYSYFKVPFKSCTNDYPWLGFDGECWNEYEFGRVYAAPEDIY